MRCDRGASGGGGGETGVTEIGAVGDTEHAIAYGSTILPAEHLCQSEIVLKDALSDTFFTFSFQI
jgi:hypothetical protein